MIITIHNREVAEDEALSKALQLVVRNGTTQDVHIYAEPRDDDGWLEYGIRFDSMYVALIQRKPGEPYESHS